MSEGEPEKGIKIYESIGQTSHYVNFGDYLLALGREKEAQSYYLKASQKYTYWHLPYLQLARLFLQQRRLGQAEQAALKALEIEQEEACVFEALSEVY